MEAEPHRIGKKYEVVRNKVRVKGGSFHISPGGGVIKI